MKFIYSQLSKNFYMDYGSWILPSGEVLNVKDPMEHYAIAAKKLGLDIKNTNYEDIYKEAFDNGWVRISHEPYSLTINPPITVYQWNKIISSLKEHNLLFGNHLDTHKMRVSKAFSLDILDPRNLQDLKRILFHA